MCARGSLIYNPWFGRCGHFFDVCILIWTVTLLPLLNPWSHLFFWIICLFYLYISIRHHFHSIGSLSWLEMTKHDSNMLLLLVLLRFVSFRFLIRQLDFKASDQLITMFVWSYYKWFSINPNKNQTNLFVNCDRLMG